MAGELVQSSFNYPVVFPQVFADSTNMEQNVCSVLSTGLPKTKGLNKHIVIKAWLCAFLSIDSVHQLY